MSKKPKTLDSAEYVVEGYVPSTEKIIRTLKIGFSRPTKKDEEVNVKERLTDFVFRNRAGLEKIYGEGVTAVKRVIKIIIEDYEDDSTTKRAGRPATHESGRVTLEKKNAKLAAKAPAKAEPAMTAKVKKGPGRPAKAKVEPVKAEPKKPVGRPAKAKAEPVPAKKGPGRPPKVEAVKKAVAKAPESPKKATAPAKKPATKAKAKPAATPVVEAPKKPVSKAKPEAKKPAAKAPVAKAVKEPEPKKAEPAKPAKPEPKKVAPKKPAPKKKATTPAKKPAVVTEGEPETVSSISSIMDEIEKDIANRKDDE